MIYCTWNIWYIGPFKNIQYMGPAILYTLYCTSFLKKSNRRYTDFLLRAHIGKLIDF